MRVVNVANTVPRFENSEFSLMVDDRELAARHHAGAVQPRGKSAGIYLYAPSRKIGGYLDLILREITQKKVFLTPSQPVRYVRFQGAPLTQFLCEEVTEIIFWLCSRFNVLDGPGVERSISLSPEQCRSDRLALLRGLGFNGIRLSVDATAPTEGKSLSPVSVALGILEEYKVGLLSGKILFDARTSPGYLNELLSALADSGAAELEIDCRRDVPEPAGDRLIAERLYTDVIHSLARRDFVLIGNGCLKRRDHPDLRLRAENRLSYGPWGFHDAGSGTWLGLGLGALGIADGYLYHNTGDPGLFRSRITAGLSPVAGWSLRPVAEIPAFAFIQALYTRHRVERACFTRFPELLDLFREREWLFPEGDSCVLTAAGRLNMIAIASLYSRECRRIESN